MWGNGDSPFARILGRWGRVFLSATVISGLSLPIAKADPRIDEETGPSLTKAAASPENAEETGAVMTDATPPQGAEDARPVTTAAAALQGIEESDSAVTDAVGPQGAEETGPVVTEAPSPQGAEETASATTTAAAPQAAEDRVCSGAHLQQQGVASWYGRHWRGRKTASGQRYDERLLTAASPSLPLPTRARVTNLQNGRSVDVIVNDRGPYVGDRIIDLSARAAALLGINRLGLAHVTITALPQHSAI
jgi:rare lipoprotein A